MIKKYAPHKFSKLAILNEVFSWEMKVFKLLLKVLRYLFYTLCFGISLD
jgi:hypothetical protein